MEQYQAREIKTFIEETERRQHDAAWLTHLASLRRIEREEYWSTQQQAYPPPASDRTVQPEHPAQTVLRPSATVIAEVPVSSAPAAPLSSAAALSASASASSSSRGIADFPAFERTVYPVTRVPDWGAMRTPAQWDRPYGQIPREEFVPLPPYNLTILRTPLQSLVDPILPENISVITAKLTYSTRYYGAYDLDAVEFTGMHPGIDIKLAFGTPLGAIAGGRVHAVNKDAAMGLYVMIEHRLPDGDTYFSLYGHFDTVSVREGQDIRPAQIIGTVGMTGNTTAPHVHLQVDRDNGTRPHQRYWPSTMPSPAQADRYTVHPIEFIRRYGSGVEG